MATTLAVDVLGCTGTTEERAGLLHKMIQIAAELKGTMGNMFGFAAIMRALELPQVRSRKTLMALLKCVISSLTTTTSIFILKETARNHIISEWSRSQGPNCRCCKGLILAVIGL